MCVHVEREVAVFGSDQSAPDSLEAWRVVRLGVGVGHPCDCLGSPRVVAVGERVYYVLYLVEWPCVKIVN